MYSLILMTAMSSAPHGPEFGGYFRNWFDRGGCYGTCVGRSYGCYGTCDGQPGLGSRIRSFFSMNGCNGCYGSCVGRGYACSGASYACNGCGVAFSCGGGGLNFNPYQTPPEFGAPIPGPFSQTPDAAPFVPGAIQPIRPGPEGVPFAPNTPAPPPYIPDRESFRSPPAGLAPQGPNRATVLVKLPADARLYAEGRLLHLTTAERTFVTPELPPGREYTYNFKIEYDRNGETVSQSRKVAVRPGATTPIEFSDLLVAKNPEVKESPLPKPTPPANTTAAPTGPTATTEKPNPFKSTEPTERARITIKLPPGATLYIDDRKHERTDPVREFTTPPLPAGKEFAYLMTVEVVRDGLPERLMEKVVFRAGEVVTRDFATAFPANQKAGR